MGLGVIWTGKALTKKYGKKLTKKYSNIKGGTHRVFST